MEKPDVGRLGTALKADDGLRRDGEPSRRRWTLWAQARERHEDKDSLWQSNATSPESSYSPFHLLGSKERKTKTASLQALVERKHFGLATTNVTPVNCFLSFLPSLRSLSLSSCSRTTSIILIHWCAPLDTKRTGERDKSPEQGKSQENGTKKGQCCCCE